MTLITENFSGTLPTGENYIVKTKVGTLRDNKFATACLDVEQNGSSWITQEVVCKIFNKYGVEFNQAISEALKELQNRCNLNLIKE